MSAAGGSKTTNLSHADRVAELLERIAKLDLALATERDAVRRGKLQRQKHHARECLQGENDMRRMNEPAGSVAPPAPNWVLVCRRQFQAGGNLYPVGSVVDVADLGRNYRSLLSSGYCEWQPPRALSVKARPLPPAQAAAPPNPTVEIVHDADDVVLSWRRTLDAMTERCGGNRARAEDLLLLDNAGSELFRRATRVRAERENRRPAANERRVS
jgi:hypothetical protein